MDIESKQPEEHIPTQEEWFEGYKAIKKLRQDVSDELRRIYGEDGWFDEWNALLKLLWEKINSTGMNERELSKYAATHPIRYSGTIPEISPYIDLPGEFSIKKFLEEKLKELKKIQ